MDARKEETALAAYWVMNGVDRCQVAFVLWHLIKHMDKYNGELVQVTDVYSAVDDSHYGRQKVYINHGFVKVVLILECDATQEAEDALFNATTSKEVTKKKQQY